MKIELFNTWFLITLVSFIVSCASHEDKLFSDNDSAAPEKLERQIDLPEQIKEKFQVKENPPEAIDVEPAKKATSSAPIKKQEAKTPKVKTVATPVPSPTPTLSAKELKKMANFKSWDIESERVWKKFKPLVRVDEEIIYEVSFLGVHAGHVKLLTKPMTKVGDIDVYHFYAQLKSGRWYDFIYKLDDYLDTYVDKETFRPVKYSLIQRESSQKVDDLQVFDFEKQKTYLDYYREKDGKTKKENKVEPIPEYFQDSYSALPFMRGVEMKIGDIHQFPIVTRGKIWLLKYEVLAEEEVKIQGKWIKALKLKAETQFPGVLEKRGDILFWFDKSDYKRPLKFQAKVKIGSVEGVLIDYKPGRPVE